MRPTAVKDVRWWDNEEPHQVVFPVVDQILDRTTARREMDLYHACLYDDAELYGLGPGSYDIIEYEPSRLAFNVVRQNVDTLTAKIAKSRPLPMPLTTGGAYEEQRRAKLFGKMIEGQFENSGVFELSPTIARDAALFGTGISWNGIVDGEIVHERVLPWEIVLAPRESMYGAPRTIYRRRWVDRLVLKERYPDFVDEIGRANYRDEDRQDIGFDDTSDLVLVIESWHLPSKKVTGADYEGDEFAHDGRFCICISSATLERHPWRHGFFPFTVLRMTNPIVGWFGTGLGKMLTGLQYTINDNLSVAQEAFALSGGYITLESGSNVKTSHIDNGRGTILWYTGTEPRWLAPNLISAEHLRFTFDLIPKSYEVTGVSQLSAQSQKPAGLNSGVALNTYLDIETERFALFVKAYERYHVDVAYQFLYLFEELSKTKKKITVRAKVRDRGRQILQDLDYKKIRMDMEDFTLQVFPTSMLAKEPAARMQQVANLAEAGWISADEAKMLLDFPDLERLGNLEHASYRLVDKILGSFLDVEEGKVAKYVYPEAPMNLELARTMAQQRYLEAKLDGAPETTLKLIMDFMVDCQAELEKAMPPSAAPPAGPAPMGPPPNVPSPAITPTEAGLPPEAMPLPPPPAV